MQEILRFLRAVGIAVLVAIFTAPLAFLVGAMLGRFWIWTSGDPTTGIAGLLFMMAAWPIFWFLTMYVLVLVEKKREIRRMEHRAGFPVVKKEDP